MHALFAFRIGGLENGLVNLINGLDPACYRHTVVCLSDYDEAFCARVRSTNVRYVALHKREGNDPRVWRGVWRLLREERPDVLHTRNFVALELQLLGVLAGVRARVHGEHGWDVNDLDGSRKKYRVARRAIGLGVHRFIALSRDLERYLVETVGIPARRVVQIYNGVDEGRFRPTSRAGGDPIVVGTVGRMKAVKHQTLLCRAFTDLLARRPDLAGAVRLVLVGSGPLQDECRAIVARAGVSDAVEFRGDSDRVDAELRGMDVFVLPSLAEGISNTILEAMASGLPVIATAVGGNPELVESGETGTLVPVDDVSSLSEAIERYTVDPGLRDRHGRAGRARVESRFGLGAMVRAYDDQYRTLVRSAA